MRHTRTSFARALGAAVALAALSAGTAGAHSQTVTPNGNGVGPEPGGISRTWAMAHCMSQAPLIVAEASNGVVQFNPARSFTDCVPGTRGNGDD